MVLLVHVCVCGRVHTVFHVLGVYRHVEVSTKSDLKSRKSTEESSFASSGVCVRACVCVCVVCVTSPAPPYWLTGVADPELRLLLSEKSCPRG